jgi:nucleotide-binding universal stress UspA family protein
MWLRANHRPDAADRRGAAAFYLWTVLPGGFMLHRLFTHAIWDTLGGDMILIAYDGSQDARCAVSKAAELFPGEPVTVLTVWQRFIDTMARVGGGVGVIVDYEAIDKDTQQAAVDRAAGGVKLAEEAGLDGTAKVAVVETTVADAILSEADAIDARAVVCGSRGYTGVKSLMLGSVSHHLLQHADLPIVVVPSEDVANARAKHRHELS